MILKSLPIHADLSTASLEECIKSLYCEPGEAITLFVSPNLMVEAQKYKLPYFVNDSLPDDSWYVKSKYFGIFSCGA